MCFVIRQSLEFFLCIVWLWINWFYLLYIVFFRLSVMNKFFSYDFLFPSFGFVLEFWVCFEHSTHAHTHARAPARTRTRARTHTTMLNARPTIFCFGVLGLFPRFGFFSNIAHTHTHTHPTMLNARPTIFCFGVLGFLSDFSFVWIDPYRCNKKK